MQPEPDPQSAPPYMNTMHMYGGGSAGSPILCELAELRAQISTRGRGRTSPREGLKNKVGFGVYEGGFEKVDLNGEC